jgi:23S rRNA A2030 N6-methylase RlmJ
MNPRTKQVEPLTDKDSLNTLNVLVSHGRATLYDLKKSSSGKTGSVEQAIKRLKERHLIAEKPAQIKDFTIYYPTSNGLRVFTDLKTKKISLSDKVRDTISSMSLLIS